MINITDKRECCGCTACQSICKKGAIEMLPDEEGFFYPYVDMDKCIQCGLCEKVCPIVKRKNTIRENSYLDLFALRIRNHDVLMKSSSGGAFSAIAEYVISQGGIVVGATYNEKMQVVHSFADNYDEYEKMRGSKYSQSNIIGVFKRCKEILSSEKTKNRLLLFSGTPCQIHGLKSFLIHDYKNLITVDIVCHSIPSPMVFEDYIKFVNNHFNDRLTNLQMRYKQKNGWSQQYSYRYVFESGMSYVDPEGLFNWGTIYFSHVINRPSCEACPYTNLDRVGDFSIADFWDENKLRPDIYSKEGTSLFIINTQKGQELFKHITDKINVWRISEREAMQPCLMRPTPSYIERKYFWKCYKKYGLEKAVKLYCVPSLRKKIRRKIRMILRLV